MISLDWKARLQADTKDFFENKLPQEDYDMDIIYNAYPERVEGKVPRDIVTLVARTLAGLLARKPQNYMKFYEYLWSQKGEQGRYALSQILARVISKNPNFFIDYMFELLRTCKDENEVAAFFDRVLFPMLKKHAEPWFDKLIRWLKSDRPEIRKAVAKLLLKLIRTCPDTVRPLIKKLENQWMNADEEMVRFNSEVLKTLAKVDEEQYFELFRHYKNTRNPVFVEILANGIILYHPVIQEAVDFWGESGNARVKKAAVNGKKNLTRKKKESDNG